MLLLSAGMFASRVNAQNEPELGSASRLGIVGGMGVSYINPQGVTDYINTVTTDRVSDFKTGVEFFGGVVVPVEQDWVIKVEYAYLLASYNITSGGSGGVSFYTHMPTVVGQYVAINEPRYNVKIGAGAGYHFGTLTTSYGSQKEYFSGTGLGTKVDLEANTAFGEKFFGYIGADFRWEFIGELTDRSGRRPPTIRNVEPPTLHFFCVGAKLGFTVYF